VVDIASDDTENEVHHLRSMVAKLIDDKAKMCASLETKTLRLKEFWETQCKNKETLDTLAEKYEELTEKYGLLEGEYNNLKADYEMLKKEVEEDESESSSSDKEFVPEAEKDKDVGVSDTPREINVHYTRSRRSIQQTDIVIAETASASIPIPNDAKDIFRSEIAEGKRKLDAIP